MINGDISNETPPRIIVLIDVAVVSEQDESKGLFRTKVERKITRLNPLALSHLWNISSKYGLSVELAAFESENWTQKHLDTVMDRLERRGGNPFNYAELYPTIQEFIDELPYRANLRGVVDIRERVARYGSLGLELENL